VLWSIRPNLNELPKLDKRAGSNYCDVMNLPTLITASRLFLSPFFFASFMLHMWADGSMRFLASICLWLIFTIVELSDIADGAVARRMRQVTDAGKLLDPFADVVARMTYFVCLLTASIMPAWVFIIILYREFGILFIRMMLFRDGIALAAKTGGKIKAVFYAIAGGAGLLVFTSGAMRPQSTEHVVFYWTAQVAFLVSAILAVISFIDYFFTWRRAK
jgi:CDP-diacylglycerol---glycerol-3-phosphate 3-phosphatidyltransferase